MILYKSNSNYKEYMTQLGYGFEEPKEGSNGHPISLYQT
jgi:hypothetical protein